MTHELDSQGPESEDVAAQSIHRLIHYRREVDALHDGKIILTEQALTN